MNKGLIYILIIFLSFSTAKTEVLEKINIQGNKRVSNETIKIYGNIEIGKDYSEKTINEIVRNLYSTDFFEEVNVNLKNSILTVTLKEYPIIDNLILLGENSKKFKEAITKNIFSKEKRSFIKNNLAKDIEIIKNIYSSLGYNFTKIDVKTKKLSEDKVDVLIEIDKGKQTKISKINFIGNDKVKSSRLREVIASEENKFWKVISKNTNLNERLINLDKRLIENYYKSIGFYDIKVTSNLAEIKESGQANLNYTINEGTRYIINKISTKIDSVFDKSIFFSLEKSFEKYIGEYYSPFKVKKLLDEIDNLIADKNLQFVEHNVEEIKSGDNININFNIFEGQKILIERINIIGNNVTNENVIRGELILDEGDPLTIINVEKSIAEIKARNIFNSVKYSINDGSSNTLKIIDIEVEEKPTGEISAGAGIGTNGGSFAINVNENNWLGEGKNLGLELEVDAESIAGSLTYLDPNYNFLGNSLSYSISSQSNDKPDQGYENSISSIGINTAFEQYKDLDVNLGLLFSHDDLRTDNTASAALKKQDGTFSDLSTIYGFTLDKRDRAFKPTSGSIVSFRQSIPIYADKSYLDNRINYSLYNAFNENLVGAAKFHLSTINGLGDDDVRLSKRKGISTRRLRGFQKNKVGPLDGSDHIGGNYVTALNLEGSLPNFLPEATRADVGIFLDFANVWGVDYDSSIDESNKIRSSTGVLMNWVSPIGPMTFTLAQDLSKANTDKTETFNFSLGTTF